MVWKRGADRHVTTVGRPRDLWRRCHCGYNQRRLDDRTQQQGNAPPFFKSPKNRLKRMVFSGTHKSALALAAARRCMCEQPKGGSRLRSRPVRGCAGETRCPQSTHRRSHMHMRSMQNCPFHLSIANRKWYPRPTLDESCNALVLAIL